MGGDFRGIRHCSVEPIRVFMAEDSGEPTQVQPPPSPRRYWTRRGLLYLRKQCKRPIHFWPFDGWEIPEGKSVVAEVYPALWMRRFPRGERDGDEQAAYATAAWLQRADRTGSLDGFLNPNLTAEERGIAKIEGWILGLV